MLKLKHTLILLAVTLFSLSSCEEEDGGPLLTSNVVQHGKWRITQFVDGGDNRSAEFQGYELSFDGNGTVTASKVGSTVPGSWSAGEDVTKAKLVLNFGTAPLFGEISEDWQVIEQTKEKIRLQHADEGGADELTITRI